MDLLDATPSSLRCADVARAESLAPAGTAGSYRGFVAVELPLPWPRELTEHPLVAPAAGALEAAGLRVQALVPDPDGPDARRQVLTFVRPDRGGFGGYDATRWTVPSDAVDAALSALARSFDPAVAGGWDLTALAATGAAGAVVAATGADAGRHLLICTHGVRDTCCGSLGTRLAAALPGLGAGIHRWRTSHTGGHRFAPTALVLPEGTAWAFLDLDVLVGIVDRTFDPAHAAAHYRGCTGLHGPEAQAADGAALAAVGWSWLDRARTGTVVARDGARTRVRLEGRHPDGTVTVLDADVEAVRMVPVPDCGRPPAEARKAAPELVVRSLTVA